MLKTNRPANLNGQTLRNELRTAGVTVGVLEMTAEPDGLVFDNLAEKDRPVVEQVIAAHTGAPTAEHTNEAAVTSRIDQAISTLENATSTKSTWDGLTAAQRQEMTRLGLLAVAKVARLVLRRFDSA